MADGLDWPWRRSPHGPELSVGVLSADLLHLGRDIERLERAGVRLVHFDLMDGRFCPELTVGPWFVAATETTMVKDVHLLVSDPENWVEPCVSAGAGIVTVHLEAGINAHRALELAAEVAERQERPTPLKGVGVCPGTQVRAVEPFLDVADVVFVLGVNPGWRQAQLPSTVDRALEAKELLAQSGRDIRLAIDGGITLDNFADVASLRPDLVVSGSAVFSGGRLEDNLASLSRGSDEGTWHDFGG